MSRLQAVSDDGTVIVDIVTDEEDETVGVCQVCGEEITGRGRFRDTVEYARKHADREH